MYLKKEKEKIITEENVLGGFGCAKRLGNYGLYFTQKRVIVAKTGISILWYLLMFIPMLFGCFLGAFVLSQILNPTVELTPWLVPFVLPLIIGPLLVLQHLLKKKSEKIDELSPENILADNKKNFQILYKDIARVEINPGLLIGNPKIKILTKNGETHKFFIAPKQFIDLPKKQIIWSTPQEKFDACANLVLSVLPDKTKIV